MLRFGSSIYKLIHHLRNPKRGAAMGGIRRLAHGLLTRFADGFCVYLIRPLEVSEFAMLPLLTIAALFSVSGGLSAPSSELAAPHPSVLFVADHGEHILLRRVPGAECSGKPRLGRDTAMVVCAPPALEAEAHLDRIGQKVVLRGPGVACPAQVVGIDLVAWTDLESGPTGRGKAAAQAAWSHVTYDDRFVAARVRSTGRRCSGARWAEVLDEARDGTLQVGSVPAAAEVKAALAHLRQHPGHAEIQGRYQAETGAVGPWDEAGELDVRVLPAAEGHYVFAGAQVGGCGEFSADFWVIWQVDATGRYTAVTDADVVGGWFLPEALIERPGARPTFLDAHLRVEARGTRYEVVEDVAVETWACPC